MYGRWQTFDIHLRLSTSLKVPGEVCKIIDKLLSRCLFFAHLRVLTMTRYSDGEQMNTAAPPEVPSLGPEWEDYEDEAEAEKPREERPGEDPDFHSGEGAQGKDGITGPVG